MVYVPSRATIRFSLKLFGFSILPWSVSGIPQEIDRLQDLSRRYRAVEVANKYLQIFETQTKETNRLSGNEHRFLRETEDSLRKKYGQLQDEIATLKRPNHHKVREYATFTLPVLIRKGKSENPTATQLSSTSSEKGNA